MENQDQWCFAWFAEQSASGSDRAALVKAARWNPGDIITVSFLDGDPEVQKKVREVALGWTGPGMANLMFEPYNKSETNYTKVDAHSIMMYPIPKTWTTDGFSVGLNSTLSDTDKKFIHKQYP